MGSIREYARWAKMGGEKKKVDGGGGTRFWLATRLVRIGRARGKLRTIDGELELILYVAANRSSTKPG